MLPFALVLFAVGSSARPEGGLAGGYGAPASYGAPYGCHDGTVVAADGSCVPPIIRRNVYVFTAPYVPRQPLPKPYIPTPQVEHNVLFIRTPDKHPDPEPIVVPPPRQEHTIYVLNKDAPEQQKVISVPGATEKPEVYFVNYEDGENPVLPGGLDLNSALAAAHEVTGAAALPEASYGY